MGPEAQRSRGRRQPRAGWERGGLREPATALTRRGSQQCVTIELFVPTYVVGLSSSGGRRSTRGMGRDGMNRVELSIE